MLQIEWKAKLGTLCFLLPFESLSQQEYVCTLQIDFLTQIATTVICARMEQVHCIYGTWGGRLYVSTLNLVKCRNICMWFIKFASPLLWILSSSAKRYHLKMKRKPHDMKFSDHCGRTNICKPHAHKKERGDSIEKKSRRKAIRIIYHEGWWCGS